VLGLGWLEICRQLQGAMHQVMGAVDLEGVGRQLTSGQEPRSGEPVLVTPKVAKLCGRLLACKVC